MTRHTLAALLVLVTSALTAQDIRQSLAGDWRFRLDPQREGVAASWFKSSLPDRLELPGSCDQRGFGVTNRVPETLRLTRRVTYEGPAWYQRDIEVPPEWNGKRVELFLERCHWETTVWVDDRRVGSQNSLSVPHVHDLGRLAPGRHVVTICVDNSYQLPIGRWAHAITEDTQGNWNGIIGRLELRATDPVWIRRVDVHPDRLTVSVGNQSGHAVEATVQGLKRTVAEGGGTVEVPFHDNAPAWDEFAPRVKRMQVALSAESWKDQTSVLCAPRELGATNRQFTLNGRPLLLRGPVDECVYPLTGYPPMDKASWLRVLRICQSYGFNFMRFHSWCPPEAAFEAGDELGFLFQIELPLWTMGEPHFGTHPAREQFLRDELDRILDTYGNHPSFALMAMGNESTGSLDTLVKAGRAKDPRRLYRCEGGHTRATGDFVETGQRGVMGPRTDWDRASCPGWIAGGTESGTTDTAVPTLAHEVGQWAMYPDFDQIAKYTGTTRAQNLESARALLETKHMADQARAFAQASGAFSVLLYKDEIEAALRTYPYGGFQVLEARDYPGQGSAIVGWLDAFWDDKGLITPEAFRRFCNATVCLMRTPQRVWTTADTFTARAELAHYGPASVDVRPEWTLADDHGVELAGGKLSPARIETGRVAPLGDVSVPLDKVAAPARVVFTLKAAGTSNSWSLWVYPASVPAAPAGVRVVHAYDAATRAALAAGERVVLFSSPREGVMVPKNVMLPPDAVRLLPRAQPGANALPGSFLPVFWNARLFNQVGTLGLLCDPKHPALAAFPTEAHSDWQWADLIGHFSAAESFRVAGAPAAYCDEWSRIARDVSQRSKSILLDEAPPDYRPIVQVIDNQDRNARLGLVFETRVGPGRLLVCALDLNTDAEHRPAARQLRHSLLTYAAGQQFAPVTELPADLLERLLTAGPVTK